MAALLRVARRHGGTVERRNFRLPLKEARALTRPPIHSAKPLWTNWKNSASRRPSFPGSFMCHRTAVARSLRASGRSQSTPPCASATGSTTAPSFGSIYNPPTIFVSRRRQPAPKSRLCPSAQFPRVIQHDYVQPVNSIIASMGTLREPAVQGPKLEGQPRPN